MLPSGFVTLERASAEPFEMKVSAEVQLFPGSRMICEVALWKIVSACHRPLQGAQDVPRLADSSHRGLNTLSPEIDVGDVVRLVHTIRGR